MPTIPFLIIALLLWWLTTILRREQKEKVETAIEEQAAAQEQVAYKPENVLSLLAVDPMEVEIGYSLIPLVDKSQGGDLFERVSLIRRQVALELGIILPAIRIRDNMQLSPNQYLIKIKGVEVASGELMTHSYLAMDAGGGDGEGIRNSHERTGLWFTCPVDYGGPKGKSGNVRLYGGGLSFRFGHASYGNYPQLCL